MGFSTDLTFSQFVPLTACLVNACLTVWILCRDGRARLNRVYAVWGISIVVWNLGTFFLFQVDQQEKALFWARFLQFGVIFLPVTLLHLCLLTTQRPIGPLLWIAYGIQGLLAISNLTPFFIRDVKEVGYAYYSVAGPGFWIYGLHYAVLTATAVVVLGRSLNTASPLRRRRIRSLLWAAGLLIFFGTNDILPILGVDTYPGTDWQIFPFGSLAAIVYGIIVGYSVLQHELLDVHITLGRLAAQCVRILFLFVLSLSLLFLAAILFPGAFSVPAFLAAGGVFLGSSFLAAFLFPRIFGGGSDALERRILGDRFEYHDKIQGFIESVPRYSDSHVLLDDVHELLINTVGVRCYWLTVLDETGRGFTPLRGYPEPAPEPFPRLTPNAPVFQGPGAGRPEYFVVPSGDSRRAEPAEEHGSRAELARTGALLGFPFFYDRDPIGLLLLGEKSSDEPYTPQDLQLLSSLAKTLSVVFNQIRLKNQLLLAQEMELMGLMSRGMAHDLNNLLTPVSTLLQMARNGEADRATLDELLPAAWQSLKTVQSYINESLFFSKHHTPQRMPTRLDRLLHRVLEESDPELKRKQLTVSIRSDVDFEVQADEVLIQRLIRNLLSNAIDASEYGSEIRLELLALSREESNDWLRLNIVDHGEGISEEHRDRIFTPYFTTKDRGEETRGFGLGLAISRKIVHLHGGQIQVWSRRREGTRVQVDLPAQPTPESREEVRATAANSL